MVNPLRDISPWANPALLGTSAKWRLGVQNADASALGVRELAAVGELRAARVAFGARIVNRRNDKLFDDPDLASSTLRVEDDLLAFGVGFDLGHHLRVGGSTGLQWSTVLGSEGTGIGWRVGTALLWDHCQLGAMWGTRKVRMDWNDAGGVTFATPAELGGAIGGGCELANFAGPLGLSAALQQEIASNGEGGEATRATVALAWTPAIRIYGGAILRGHEYETPTVWEAGTAVTVGRVTLFGGRRFSEGAVSGAVYAFGVGVSHP